MHFIRNVTRLQLLFLISALLSTVGCTNATVTEQSLGLQSNKFSILQNTENVYLKVKSSDNSTTFTVDCPKNVTELYSSISGGSAMEKLQDIDCSSGAATVSYNFSSFSGAQKVRFRGKGKQLETKEVEVTFIKPTFNNSSLSVVVNSGALKTNTMAVVLSLSAQLKFESMTFSPKEFYVTSVAGCGSGGGWIPYAPLAAGTFLTVANAQNYVYVKFRDEFDVESNCVYDDIIHDGVAPVSLSFQINSGAAQTLFSTVNLAMSASDSDLTDMKISNNDSCTGGTWETYGTSKTGWSLAGPGTNKLSVIFRDAVGNLSICRTASIVYDTLPPVMPTSITLSPSFTNPDNEANVSFIVSPVIDGDTAKLYSDASCSTEVGSGVGAGGSSAQVLVSLSTDGPYTFWAKVVDPGALTSSCTTVTGTYTLDRSAPTVLYLDSSLPNADYVTGQTVSVNVVFSEVVVVTGAPQLELDINGTATRLASYSSGSGTNTLTFSYVVASNDADADLDVVSTASLLLNSGTIADTLGNTADLTLPAPGTGPNSLGFRRNLKLNYEVQVAQLFAPLAKIYNYNEEISVTVKFTSPVVVTGTPRIKLNFDTCVSPTLVNYLYMNYVPIYRASGYGPAFLNEMTFRGTMPQNCTDLTGFSVTSTGLELNAGTIKHAILLSDANITLPATTFTEAKTMYSQSTVPHYYFAANRYMVTEGQSVNITVQASAAVAAGQTATLSYRVMGYSSASAADHDLALTGTINFTSADTTKTITLTAVDDALLEGMETLYIYLTDTTSGRIGAGSTQQGLTTVTIVDNDTPTIEQISMGTAHGCIRYTGGRLSCWGSNNRGQLGVGYPNTAENPVTVFSFGVTDVSARGNSTCAIVSGQLYCWGDNTYGQLGSGGTSTTPVTLPQLISTPSGVYDVELNTDWGCLLFDSTNRKLTCWGSDSSGRLGNGATSSVYAPSSTAILTGVQNFSISNDNGCAVKTDGTAYCWGSDSYGQIGNGAVAGLIQSPSLLDISAYSPATAVQVVSGLYSTCLLLSTGAVTCWGESSSYRLGNNDSTTDLISIPSTPIGTGFSEIFTGANNAFYCGRKSAALHCWGYTIGGFFSAAVQYQVPTAVTETATNNFYSLDATMGVICFVDSTRKAVGCTNRGLQNFPQSNPNLRVTPVDVTDLNIAEMSLSEKAGCFVTSLGELKCSSASGETNYHGDGYTGGMVLRSAPVVIARSGVSKVATGDDVTCFLRTDSSVWCYGYAATNYALGEGSISGVTYTPRFVGSGFSDLKSGWNSFCGIRSGEVFCWGSNYYGQIGNNDLSVNARRPVSTGVTGALGLAMLPTSMAACAWGTDFVKCWGRGSEFQIGDGSNNNAPAPVDMVNVYQQTPRSVSMGMNHVCVVFTDDTVRCWGRNAAGQLGRGTTTDLPFAIDASLSSVSSVASGYQSNCALKNNGNLICWGKSYSNVSTWGAGRGLLGTLNSILDNETSASSRESSPTLTNVTRVWAGAGTTNYANQNQYCAKSGANTYCWGATGSLLPPANAIISDYAPRYLHGY